MFGKKERIEEELYKIRENVGWALRDLEQYKLTSEPANQARRHVKNILDIINKMLGEDNKLKSELITAEGDIQQALAEIRKILSQL